MRQGQTVTIWTRKCVHYLTWENDAIWHVLAANSRKALSPMTWVFFIGTAVSLAISLHFLSDLSWWCMLFACMMWLSFFSCSCFFILLFLPHFFRFRIADPFYLESPSTVASLCFVASSSFVILRFLALVILTLCYQACLSFVFPASVSVCVCAWLFLIKFGVIPILSACVLSALLMPRCIECPNAVQNKIRRISRVSAVSSARLAFIDLKSLWPFTAVIKSPGSTWSPDAAKLACFIWHGVQVVNNGCLPVQICQIP